MEHVSVDPFYSESNMRYLEGIAHDVAQGKAHFAEHELEYDKNEVRARVFKAAGADSEGRDSQLHRKN